MRVVWTEAALSDLDSALAYTAENYPNLVRALESRIRTVLIRIGRWPESARTVDGELGIRVVPLLRFPYRIFYRVMNGQVEILHLHHASRDEPS
jgi:toxin ParE1/3/4